MSKIFAATDIFGNNTNMRNNLLNLTEKYGEIKLTGLTKKERYLVYCSMSFPLAFKKLGGTRNQDKDILVNNVSKKLKNNNVEKESCEISNNQKKPEEIFENIVRINTHYTEMFDVHKKLIWMFICVMFIDIYVNFLEMYYRYELLENDEKYCYVYNNSLGSIA